MTTVTAQNVLDLYNAQGFDNAVLTDVVDQITVVERVQARQQHWPILAYQVDLVEEYPEGMTEEQAQARADQINEQRVAAAARAAALGRANEDA